jgi:hypothetical protein
VERFNDSRDAMSYLVKSIIAEAERKNIPLSQTERDMMFFSETAWTPLPDYAATSEAFDRECDPEEYEEKIQDLIRSFRARTRKSDRNSFDEWNRAVEAIRSEDHYLLVLIGGADAMGSAIWPPTQRTVLIVLLIAGVLAEIGDLLITRR